MMFLFLIAALGLARDQTFLKLREVTSLKQGPEVQDDKVSRNIEDQIALDDKVSRNIEDQIALDFVLRTGSNVICQEVYKEVAEILANQYFDLYIKSTDEYKIKMKMPQSENVRSELLRPSNYQDECKDIMMKWTDGIAKEIFDQLYSESESSPEESAGRLGKVMYEDKKGRKKNENVKDLDRNGGISKEPIEALQNFFTKPIFHARLAFGPHGACDKGGNCPAQQFRDCGVPFVGGASGTLRLTLFLLSKANREDLFRRNLEYMLAYMSGLVLNGHHSWTELVMVAHEMGYLNEGLASPVTVRDGCMKKENYKKMIESLQEMVKKVAF